MRLKIIVLSSFIIIFLSQAIITSACSPASATTPFVSGFEYTTDPMVLRVYVGLNESTEEGRQTQEALFDLNNPGLSPIEKDSPRLEKAYLNFTDSTFGYEFEFFTEELYSISRVILWDLNRTAIINETMLISIDFSYFIDPDLEMGFLSYRDLSDDKNKIMYINIANSSFDIEIISESIFNFLGGSDVDEKLVPIVKSSSGLRLYRYSRSGFEEVFSYSSCSSTKANVNYKFLITISRDSGHITGTNYENNTPISSQITDDMIYEYFDVIDGFGIEKLNFGLEIFTFLIITVLTKRWRRPKNYQNNIL